MTLAEGIEQLRRESLVDASPRIGAYLEKVGKSDLADMTETEWFGFLETVVTEYRASHARLSEAPF